MSSSHPAYILKVCLGSFKYIDIICLHILPTYPLFFASLLFLYNFIFSARILELVFLLALPVGETLYMILFYQSQGFFLKKIIFILYLFITRLQPTVFIQFKISSYPTYYF